MAARADWNRIADGDLAELLRAGWPIEKIADFLDRPTEEVELRRQELHLDDRLGPPRPSVRFRTAGGVSAPTLAQSLTLSFARRLMAARLRRR